MFSKNVLPFSVAASIALCCGVPAGSFGQVCDPKLTEQEARAGTVANALAGMGQDAVTAGNLLIKCFPTTDRSYFVRSTAHAAWYHNRVDSCRRVGTSPCAPAEDSKRRSYDDILEADRILQQTKPGDAQYVTLLAHRHEEFGDTLGAATLFEESLQKEPNQADVYYHLIDRENRKHNLAAVEAYFERLTAQTKNKHDVLSYVEHLLRNVQFEKAEKVWKLWKPLFGNDFMFRYKRLKLLALSEQYEFACNSCDSLILEYPNGMPREFHLPTKDTVYFLCAEVNLEYGKTDNALMMYDRAVEIAPSGTNYYTRISSILKSMPQFYYENYRTRM